MGATANDIPIGVVLVVVVACVSLCVCVCFLPHVVGCEVLGHSRLYIPLNKILQCETLKLPAQLMFNFSLPNTVKP